MEGGHVSFMGIDTWIVPLDVEEECRQRLFAMLSRDEQVRAQQFRYARDSRRFVVRRGRLRQLLGRQLGCDAGDVPICAGAFGKPMVAGADLRFNLSHSNGFALYATAPDREIGCDLEWLGSRLATEQAAALVLSDAEREVWKRTGEARRTEVFLRYWTCKEAYLKARGIGLEPSLRDITVSADDPARVVALPDDDASAWLLLTFCPIPGYVAALAARRSSPTARN